MGRRGIVLLAAYFVQQTHSYCTPTSAARRGRYSGRIGLGWPNHTATPVHKPSAFVFPSRKRCHDSWVSWMMSSASTLPNALSSNPKAFKGLPSGVLYHWNHSRMPDITPG